MECLAQRNKIKFIKILFSLETSMQFGPYFFSDENPNFIWSQKTEKQKLYIEYNVMSEQVKMPVRHFLRRDYLHIFFYLKFWVFVSLASQKN